MDNEAFGPNDFTEFSVTAPTNSLLASSGQSVGGFLDPIAIRAPQNVIKAAVQFGKQKGHWNGFDFSIDARLRNNLYIQGGVGVGKGMSDVCDIADDVPGGDALPVPAGRTGHPAGHPVRPSGTAQTGSPAPQAAPARGRRDCTATRKPRGRRSTRRSAPTRCPWYGVRVSGTWQSIIGPQLAGFTTYSETANSATTFSRVGD